MYLVGEDLLFCALRPDIHLITCWNYETGNLEYKNMFEIKELLRNNSIKGFKLVSNDNIVYEPWLLNDCYFRLNDILYYTYNNILLCCRNNKVYYIIFPDIFNFSNYWINFVDVSKNRILFRSIENTLIYIMIKEHNIVLNTVVRNMYLEYKLVSNVDTNMVLRNGKNIALKIKFSKVRQ